MKQLLFEVILFINQWISHPNYFYNDALDPLDWFAVVIKYGERMALSWWVLVFEKKKCMKSCGCSAFKMLKNKMKTNIKQLITVLKNNSIFMFLILHIAASCWLPTLHWSSYWLGQSSSSYTALIQLLTWPKFYSLYIFIQVHRVRAQTWGSRAWFIHQLQMYTFLDSSTMYL